MEFIDIPFEGCEVRGHLARHGSDDDLLSAGLGLSGLQALIQAPLAPLDWPARRRRAIHANWQGIAFLALPDAGLSTALARPVSGREMHAHLRLAAGPGHRVMLQVPDHFDPHHPRVLVTAASGSRGVFGAIALAAPWGLPRGWAVVYTDKGCGTDWYDVDSGCAPDLLGAMTDEPSLQVFRPSAHGVPAHHVLIPHAHSGVHPEAHWGEFVQQARRFAWAALDRLFPAQRPSQARRRRCLVVGLSNGGAAVLRALADRADTGFDGAVVLAPNVLPRSGGRAFLDYASEAGLYLPLALQLPAFAAEAAAAEALLPNQLAQRAEVARAALQTLGRRRPDPRQALRYLRRRGWPRPTLGAAVLSTLFDFWYAAAATYCSALACAGAATPPLGSGFAALGAAGEARASTDLERALWWSDSAGIVPGAGVGIVDPRPRAEQWVLLHRLLHGAGRDPRIARGIAATRCGPPAPGVPLILIHGQRDGLIPPAFSSIPYERMANAAGSDLVVWRPEDAPHFDAFLGLPGFGKGLSPLLPYAAEALDQLALRMRG
jgi:hydroxybutyrate-dimer hydrolase